MALAAAFYAPCEHWPLQARAGGGGGKSGGGGGGGSGGGGSSGGGRSEGGGACELAWPSDGRSRCAGADTLAALPPALSRAALLQELAVCTAPRSYFSADAASRAASAPKALAAARPLAAAGRPLRTRAAAVAAAAGRRHVASVGMRGASPASTAATSSTAAAAAAASALPRLYRGNWTLYADRPGKPGWISTGPSGSTLEFDVRFGARPALALSYLSSHDATFGEVLVRMRAVEPGAATRPADWRRAYALRTWEVNRVRLHGRRADGLNGSTTATMHMQVGEAIMQSHEMSGVRHPVYKSEPPAEPFTWTPVHVPGIMGFGVPPHASATLIVELLCERCKFKIVSVVTC